MKNIRIIEVILVLGLGLLIWDRFWNKEPIQKGFVINNYHTDTLKSLTPYHIPRDTHGITVNPHIVVNYPPIDLSGIKIKMNDSLLQVVDSLHKHLVIINQNYLKMAPTAEKILYGKFTRDSLSLDLLNINGSVETLHWPVNYLGYNYSYNNGKLIANPTNYKTNKKGLTHRLIGYGGYDWAWKAPMTSIQYNVEMGRINGTLEPMLYIQQNPQLMLQTKIGYRLTK